MLAGATVRIVPGLEEPLVPTGLTNRFEDSSLDEAISQYKNTRSNATEFRDAVKPFTAFLERHPTTAWRTAIELNLGLGYYRAGYFTFAFQALDHAWQAGRHITEGPAKAVVDRAAGELARMHSRVGNAAALEALIADTKGRLVSGPATELIAGANEALWRFRNDPGTSYLCGPMALKNLLVSLKADPQKIRAIDEVRSGPSGFSLAEVSELATTSGLNNTLVYRPRGGAPIPVPSVVNWKVNHFAAIVGEAGGLYHIQDPTFSSGDFWVSKDVIDLETSGYFLVPADVLSKANSTVEWRVATAEEAHRVFGKGNTDENDLGATKPKDKKIHPDCGGHGMCVANAHSMLVSLNLTDVPVGYEPQKGPSALIRLTYNQREAFQPATFGFFNIGPKWNLNLLSWVQDDPALAGKNVLRYESGGGAVDYRVGYAFNAGTGAFTPEVQGGAVLVRNPASGPLVSYDYIQRDGSRWVYSRSDGATTGMRRIFLSRMIDPAGNALVLQYDSQLRLIAMTDATGRSTRFDYGIRSAPLSITRITDPFGRFASLRYTAQGYLASITDVIGITSSFTYDGGGAITAMTTPYGTTQFTFGQNTAENSRFLTIIDPMGLTERVEFRHQAPGITSQDAAPPPGSMPGLSNGFLEWRNTFYWDKHAYSSSRTDYTKARITHWLHGRYPENALKTSGIVESTKAPLENRIWYAYPEQQGTYPGIYQGSTASPIAVGSIAGGARVEFRTLDGYGTPITITDPSGRLTTMSYDASGIDLLSLGKRIDGVVQTVSAFTYNAQHRRLSSRDAAGQVTQYSYNAAGQPTSKTDQLGKTQSLTYDALGRVVRFTNANGKTDRSITYDAYDRMSSSTDSEGYVLSYEHDALDRVTKVTYPDTTTTHYTYSNLDLAAVTDRLGRTTRYVYDANRRLVGVTDPLGLITSYAYYETPVLKSITDPRGNMTRWDIDIQSRRISKVFANNTKEFYTYDEGSRLKTKVDANGRNLAFSYDNDDRLNAVYHLINGNYSNYRYFHWDSSLPRLKDAGAVGYQYYTFAYNPVGALGALQLASETNYYCGPQICPTEVVSYSYDAVGRLVSQGAPGGTETIGYDALDRIVTHNNDVGNFQFTYLGESKQVSSRNDFVPSLRSAGFGTTRWDYLSNVGDRRLKAASDSILSTSYSYESAPERGVEKISGSDNWNYAYDAGDRLTSATGTSAVNYTYDPSGNITSLSSQYNGVNEIVDPSVRYDLSGNLIEDRARTYQWDQENRLSKIVAKNGAGQSTFKYDAFGRRAEIIDESNTVKSTHYTWCDNRICSATDDTTSRPVISRRYYAEGEVREGIVYYYARDHLGSVRASLTQDPTTGLLSRGDNVFGPYGDYRDQRRAGVDFGYAGMFYHMPTGLYLTRYRVYDPLTARWLSRDPLGEVAGINLYSYVNGNPISKVDPRGLWGFGVTGGVTAEAGTGILGAAGQANAGVGFFHYPGQDLDLVGGSYTATGGGVLLPNPTGGDVDKDPVILGATAGMGVGGFITNARCDADLLGPFDTWTLNLPLVSVQFGSDSSGTWIGSLSFGKSMGLSFSRYPVTTSSSSGCACGDR